MMPDPKPPYPALERVARYPKYSQQESSLASGNILTDVLLLGVRLDRARGVQLRLGGRLVFAESGDGERLFELPILAWKNTAIEFTVDDGAVELLGYELLAPEIDWAVEYVRRNRGLFL